MATRHITIIGINPDDTLVLEGTDNERTMVDPGDTLLWDIAPNSGVASITNIVDNSEPTDLFSTDPAPLGGSTSWKGVIKSTIAPGSSESYTITGTRSNGGGNFSFDPIIQVNP